MHSMSALPGAARLNYAEQLIYHSCIPPSFNLSCTSPFSTPYIIHNFQYLITNLASTPEPCTMAPCEALRVAPRYPATISRTFFTNASLPVTVLVASNCACNESHSRRNSSSRGAWGVHTGRGMFGISSKHANQDAWSPIIARGLLCLGIWKRSSRGFGKGGVRDEISRAKGFMVCG